MQMFDPARPGEIIREACLGLLGLTVTAAADALGVTRKALSDLLNGHSGVSPEMAIRLEKVGWSTADHWLRVRAAGHGRSAEAEHREVLRMVLTGAPAAHRQEAADRLAAFRQRTAGRGGPAASELLAEGGSERLRPLAGPTPDTSPRKE